MKTTATLLTMVLLSIAALTGCSVSPIDIKSYGILPLQSNTSGKILSHSQSKKILVYIAAMSANDPYQSTQIFYLRPTLYQIKAYNYNQWIAPPTNMLTNVLTQYLNETDNITAISGSYIGGTQLSLTTNLNALVQSFTSDDTSTNVMLNITAIVTDSSSGETLQTKNFIADIAAPPNPSGMVKASNQAANQIVKDIARWIQKIAEIAQNNLEAP